MTQMSNVGESMLKMYLRELVEGEFKVTSELAHASYRLLTATTGDELTVNDVLNNIRSLPGITVVKQIGAAPYVNVQGGRHVLLIDVKFFPADSKVGASAIALARQIRAIKAVDLVKIVDVGGRQLKRDDGKSYVF